METPQKVKPGELLPCKNCSVVFHMNRLHKVMSFRFCDLCYNKMKEIGQIVKDPRKDDGSETILWFGDPFNKDRYKFDPYPHMNKPHKGIWSS